MHVITGLVLYNATLLIAAILHLRYGHLHHIALSRPAFLLTTIWGYSYGGLYPGLISKPDARRQEWARLCPY